MHEDSPFEEIDPSAAETLTSTMTMSQKTPPPSEFVSRLLSRESSEYRDAFNCEGDIDALIEHARSIIQVHTATLKDIRGGRLDGILPAMLKHAPHSEGQRYVATVLIVAHSHSPEMVVEVASAWMDLFYKSELPTSISHSQISDNYKSLCFLGRKNRNQTFLMIMMVTKTKGI